MHFTTVFATLAVLVTSTLVLGAPPSLLSVETFKGETSGGFIVKFKTDVSSREWIKRLKLAPTTRDFAIINGIAANLNEDALNTLRASPDVESISEDGIMHTLAGITQTDAPWGLSRIGQAGILSSRDVNALTYSYTYDESAGNGVDIYVADTGVQVTHTQFGGRARWGGTFGTVGTTDGHGHGTHCAGTAAGSQFGVAKNASIIAVKVLSDGGSGSVAGIVSGLDWILQQVTASGRPSIVSMSLGGSATTPLDDAVTRLTASGVHVVVAAGNSNDDAIWYSPARTPSAITIGASNILDQRASFSNYGSVVDVFAPGQNVISAWIGSSNSATNSISGTSMATPHVAGLAAYLISKEGNTTPALLEARIKELSVKGVLTNIPGSTANLMAQLGPVDEIVEA